MQQLHRLPGKKRFAGSIMIGDDVRLLGSIHGSDNYGFILLMLLGCLHLNQSRRLDIRMRLQRPTRSPDSGSQSSQSDPSTQQQQQQPGSAHVHMLNSTLTATQRTLSCLLETHQTPDGVVVPEPLRSFMGTDFLPFRPPSLRTLQRWTK